MRREPILPRVALLLAAALLLFSCAPGRGEQTIISPIAVSPAITLPPAAPTTPTPGQTPTVATSPSPTAAVVGPSALSPIINTSNTGKLVEVGSIEAASIVELHWSPSGSLFAVMEGDKLRVFAFPSLLEVATIPSMPVDFDFTYDRNLLAFGYAAVGLQLFDPSTGRLEGVLSAQPSQGCTPNRLGMMVSTDPLGRYIATAITLPGVAAPAESELQLVAPSLGACPSSRTGIPGVIYDHHFSTDGRLFAIGVAGGAGPPSDTTWLMDVPSLGIRCHFGGLVSAFNPREPTIATAQGAQVDFWDGPTCQHLGRWSNLGSDIQRLAFSPDGKLLACAGSGLLLLDAATGQSLVDLHVSGGPIYGFVEFSPDGRTILIASAPPTGHTVVILQSAP